MATPPVTGRGSVDPNRRIEVSVIVRARDEDAAIGRCLELVRGQEGFERSLELIIVDSGSHDRTVEIAREHGARVLSVPPEKFSFGAAE